VLHKAIDRLEALNQRLERSMYPGGRPNRVARLLNRAWALIGRVGLWPKRLVTLEVRGRRSGMMTSLPLVVADLKGERYLVAMLGERTHWVHNVRAAGGRAVLRHGRGEAVRLEEVDPAARAPILRRYARVAPGGRAMIQIQPDAPLVEFERLAGGHPVFHITADSAASGVRTTPRLWAINRLVNPGVRLVLRAGVPRRLGGALALLTYRGAITGREVTAPVQYVRHESGCYVIVPGDPDHKRWWRNLRQPGPVRLRIAGQQVTGIGRVVDGDDEGAALLASYAEPFPRFARTMVLRTGSSGPLDRAVLVSAAREMVVVVVTPDAASPDPM
jgi:deazaflavin-dependent oxidoreductase (nitroreductase family)